MPCFAMVAAFSLDVHDRAQPTCFKNRIRRWHSGERGELKEREGEDAEAARVPR